MHITTVSSDIIWKDATANVPETERHVKEVLRRFPATQIILFPELSLTGSVSDGNAELAEPLGGSSVTALRDIAKKHGVAFICGFISKNDADAQKPFNTAVVIGKNGEVLAHYHKNHLYEGSREPLVYTRGDELMTFELEGWKCGISICFDIRFPRLFEAYRKAGVECMFSGFNWYAGRNKPDILETLIKVRAHENQFFFAAVDRSGTDPNGSFTGVSVIATPYAENIAQRDGIYSYAEIKKEDIATLHKALPLEGSFKESYSL